MRGIFRNGIVGLAVLGTVMTVAPAFAADSFKGNVGAYSKYVLRGITNAPENDNTAIQGGLDYSHDSGFYLGYWGSNLGYVYDAAPTNVDGVSNGYENDFYAGYNASLGDVGVQLGLIQYYYMNVDDSNLTEAVIGATYGPAYAMAQYLLTDGVWGNAGDIYWKIGFNADLPKKFKINVEGSWYTYEDDDNSELGATTETDSEFRYVTTTLSHPIGDTGADMLITYIVGGKDRTDTEQGDMVVMGAKFGFDI